MIVLRLPSLAATVGSAVLLLPARPGGSSARPRACRFWSSRRRASWRSVPPEARPYAIATFTLVAATLAWSGGSMKVGAGRSLRRAGRRRRLDACSRSPSSRIPSTRSFVSDGDREPDAGVPSRGCRGDSGRRSWFPWRSDRDLWDERGSLSIPNQAGITSLLIILVPRGSRVHCSWRRVAGSHTGGRLLSMPTDQGFVLHPVRVLATHPLARAVRNLRVHADQAPRAATSRRSRQPSQRSRAGISSIQPASARRFVVALLALLSVLGASGSLKNGEDWRGAAAPSSE